MGRLWGGLHRGAAPHCRLRALSSLCLSRTYAAIPVSARETEREERSVLPCLALGADTASGAGCCGAHAHDPLELCYTFNKNMLHLICTVSDCDFHPGRAKPPPVYERSRIWF